VGIVAFINKTYYIHIRYAPGFGTNNKDESFSFWSLLEAAKEKDIKKLYVLHDANMVIDWACQNKNIQNISLAPIVRDKNCLTNILNGYISFIALEN